MLQNRWSHLFCISPFCVILTVIFYFVGQIENKSYFLPNQAVQTLSLIHIFHDVQLLWAFVFANFFLSIITSVYGISTYATNRLDLTSIRTMYGDIIRIVFLFGTFLIFKPTLWFIGAASLLSTAYTAFWNRRFTRQLLPQVQMKISNFRWKKVWELVSLGAWNSLTRLGPVSYTHLMLSLKMMNIITM